MQNSTVDSAIPANGNCEGEGFSIEYTDKGNVAYFDTYLSRRDRAYLQSVIRSHGEYTCFGCTVAANCRARIFITLRSDYRRMSVAVEQPNEDTLETTEVL